MSGTSARESYRSGKRTRPSDSAAGRTPPPVLFRLPSVAIPGHDASLNASTANSATMAMPMVASSALQAAASSMTASSAATSPATPSANAATAATQTAAVTTSTEKTSSQSLLNMLIIVLLLAAIAVIALISMNGSTPSPSMADRQVGNTDAGLDTLGDLKVPDVNASPVTQPAIAKTSEKSSSGLDSVEPSATDSESLIDLPETKPQAATIANSDSSESDSLLIGLDSSASNTPATSSTAQIQLRPAVPLGGSNVTSLVDAQKPASTLNSATLGSTNTSRFETVSTPSPASKVFPANPANAASSDVTPGASATDAATATTSSNKGTDASASGGSPSLYDGARQSASEGLQLSSKSALPSTPTQVSISKPLSQEIAMPNAQVPGVASTGTQASSQLAAGQSLPTSGTSAGEQGVTVGAGAPEPYTMPTPNRTALHNSRPDLDPRVLALVAASGAAKSAVTSSATATTSNAPINSYATGATSTAGQNQYSSGGYTNATPTYNGKPINSYAQVQGSVPTGLTNNSNGAYVPPTSSTATVAGQYPTTQAQMVSGTNSVPGMPASYTLPPRGAQQPTYSQPGNQQPTYQQPGMQQPGYQQPQQPTYQQPNYQQPQQPNLQQPQQPTYQQRTAQPYGTNAYGQPNNTYGAPSGSGYANPAYPSPSANMQGASMPTAGYQSGASYPTKPVFPGTPSIGLIGPNGNATAPTSDIAPIPVTGRMGSATSAPYGTPQ